MLEPVALPFLPCQPRGGKKSRPIERLAALAELGKPRTHVERALPLEQIAHAQALVERGATPGKIVLLVARNDQHEPIESRPPPIL